MSSLRYFSNPEGCASQVFKFEHFHPWFVFPKLLTFAISALFLSSIWQNPKSPTTLDLHKEFLRFEVYMLFAPRPPAQKISKQSIHFRANRILKIERRRNINW